MDKLRRDMQAMTNRLTTRLDEVSRARSSSPISATQQTVTPTPSAIKSSTPPPQLDPPAAVTQQQLNSPAKKKRNERTRQQYKRKKALHVTVQLSFKEVEHTVRVEYEKKPGEHVVLQRTKQVPWDGSATSRQLWCWHAAIQCNGMAMVMVL